MNNLLIMFQNQPLAFSEPRDTGSAYTRGNTGSRRVRYDAAQKAIVRSDIFAYPLDIDLDQDHFKITKYKYVRPNINQSKSARVKKIIKIGWIKRCW